MDKSEVEKIARQIAKERNVHFMQFEKHAEPNSWRVTFSDDNGSLKTANFIAADSTPEAIRRNILQLAFGVVE